MEYVLYGLGAIGLVGGAFLVARSPSFWIEFGEELLKRLLPDLLKVFKNRPKTPEEWEDWRRLSSMKEFEMSAKDRARYRELKKLNSDYRKTI